MIELKASARDLEVRGQRQEVLVKIGRKALAGGESDQLFGYAVREAAGILGADIVCVFEPAAEDGRLRLTAHSAELAFPQAPIEADPGTDLGCTCSCPGHRLLVEDFAAPQVPRCALVDSDREIACGMAVSIDGRTGPRAILAAYSHVAGHFNEADLQFLRDVAELLGLAMERKRAELQAIAEAKAKAEEASAAKTRFLAAASHDLRQPVQAAHLFLGALLGANKDPRLQPAIANMATSLESMANLLDTLLDISRLDAGMIVPHKLVVPIADIIAPLVQDARPVAENKAIRLTCVGSRLAVHTDPALLSQLLRNLVANAVRYTARGRVLIGCRRRGREAEVQVWDTGVGIPDEARERIFCEFYQVDNDARQMSKGFGLGLSIVDRVAKLLGCRVTVRSAVGKGSVFSVTVPLG